MYRVVLVFMLFAVSANAQKLEMVLDVKPFEKIEVRKGMKVELVKSNTEQVHFIGEEEATFFDVEVEGNTLKIQSKSHWYQKSSPKHLVKIYYQEVRDIMVKSGSEITIADTLRADFLRIESHTGAILKMQLSVKELDLEVSNGSEVKLSGYAKKQTIDINKGSNLNAYNLQGEETEIEVSTGSTAHILGKGDLTASATLGGTINYKETPDNFYESTSLGGNISQEI